MFDSAMHITGALATGGAVALASNWTSTAIDLANARFVKAMTPLVEDVGGDIHQLQRFARLWRLGVVAVSLGIIFGLKMIPVGIITLIIGFLLGPVIVEWWVAKRRRTLETQTAMVTRLLAAQVRAGLTPEEAFQSSAKETPAPLGQILKRTTMQLEQGKDMRNVLQELKNQLKVDAISLLCTTLLVQKERGGKVADVLNRISHNLEELQRIARKRDADTAAGRLMVVLMSIFPILFLMMFSFLDPQTMQPMYDTVAGHVVLAIVGVLVYVSIRWSSRILAKVE